jgi:hypothetical protein
LNADGADLGERTLMYLPRLAPVARTPQDLKQNANPIREFFEGVKVNTYAVDQEPMGKVELGRKELDITFQLARWVQIAEAPCIVPLLDQQVPNNREVGATQWIASKSASGKGLDRSAG